MDNFTTYTNGIGKPAIILDSDKAEEFFNRKCKPEIRERIERVSQKMKKQINNK